MRTRPVRADGLDLFVEAASSPEHRKEVERYLESMFAAGSMRPEWCFVAEKEDRPLGRVAFWTLPGMEEPFAVVLLDVPWEDGDYVGVGTRLLGDVLNEARGLGAKEIEHVLDTPPMRPQFQHHPEKRVELLESLGFAFRRETARFEWRRDSRRARGVVLPDARGGWGGRVRRRDEEGLRGNSRPRDPRGAREARPATGGTRVFRGRKEGEA